MPRRRESITRPQSRSRRVPIRSDRRSRRPGNLWREARASEGSARIVGRTVSKSAAVALALTAALAGAIAGYLAFAAPWSAGKVTGDSSAARAVWTEVGWPFPIDQWGTGRAFACKAADCGGQLKLYLRAKLGTCNCTTGVADDDDLDRMSDFDLVGGEVRPSALAGPSRLLG